MDRSVASSTRRNFLRASIAVPVAALATRGLAGSADARPIKVGQFGTRHAHAGGQYQTLRKYPDVFEIVGVVEPDPDRRAAAARQSTYRNARWMTAEQLLDHPGLQAVAVETEVSQLLPTAHQCIDAGLHIHLDKPAGESFSSLRKLHANAKQKGLTIQMGYMFRYNPAFQFMFQAVRKKWLGNVFEVDCVMSKKIGAGSRRELAAYPGGTMFELGCHLIDPLLHMFGEPDATTPYVRRTRPEADTLADNMLAVLEYPTATCTVRSAVVEVDGGRRRQFIVCGDRGTIVIRPLEPPRLELTLEADTDEFRKGTQTVTLSPALGRYDGAWLDFARVIHGEKPHDFSHEHDLAVQRTLLKACDLPLE